MLRPAALLVHGNAGSSHVWKRVIGATQATCAAQDLPGFGAASRAPLPTGDPLAAYVADIESAARFLDLGEGIVLVGNGIGSVLCAHAALRLANVRGVVMTAPVGLVGGHARMGFLSRTRLGATLLRCVGTSVGRRRFLGDQLAAPDAEAAAILCDALRSARGFHLLARLNTPRSLDGLRALRCPVQVLWGDRDGVLPSSRAAEFMSHLPPHATLEILPGASHALPLERPAVVARAIDGIA
ncbi:MAG: alpha/beta hydrolase [Planctomycetes bacterium]|nr:alpha/beta hydrolase [Planctomycetota bacterium]